MARTAEQILVQMIGSQAIQIASMQAQIEAQQEQIGKLTPKPEPTKEPA